MIKTPIRPAADQRATAQVDEGGDVDAVEQPAALRPR
jgi:hypothetical protein